MQAMVLTSSGGRLEPRDLPQPSAGPGEVLVQVLACGVCRTDLHLVDGELADPALPLIPGHEVVGRVVEVGPGVSAVRAGDRVGVPWLGGTCGACPWCLSGRENLCDAARFTGYTVDGGYAEYAVAAAEYCFPVPDGYADEEAAPLFCAGFIGYRAYRFAGRGERLGLYGFGAAAHILAQLAHGEGREVHAFVRRGDEAGRQFALELGARWAGWSDEPPPVPLDAAILFAPVGALVPAALAAVTKGGVVVCAGIHMSDIPAFPYRLLWGERVLRSVANLTRADGQEFLAAVGRHRVRTRPVVYPLTRANDALDDLRAGRVNGAAVLVTER
jgi:propanol-preferring alcohol dehydrogenase